MNDINEGMTSLHIEFAENIENKFIFELENLLLEHRGNADVFFHIFDQEKKEITIKVGKRFKIAISNDFTVILKYLMKKYHNCVNKAFIQNNENKQNMLFLNNNNNNTTSKIVSTKSFANSNKRINTNQKKRIEKKEPLLTDYDEIMKRTLLLFNGEIKPGECNDNQLSKL